jgi:hypothetical protein
LLPRSRFFLGAHRRSRFFSHRTPPRFATVRYVGVDIEFIPENGGGPGVRLRKTPPLKRTSRRRRSKASMTSPDAQTIIVGVDEFSLENKTRDGPLGGFSPV